MSQKRLYKRLGVPMGLVCSECGRARVWGYPCQCWTAVLDTTPAPRSGEPFVTPSFWGSNRLIAEEDVTRAEGRRR